LQAQNLADPKAQALCDQNHLRVTDEAADRIIASVEQWARSQDHDLPVPVCDFLSAGRSED
jgi:hypothetical protein